MKYTFQKSLGRLTQQVSKGLGRLLEDKFTKAGYSVTAAQWSVISYLNQNNMANQKNIGDFLGVNKVMIKRILDILETRDLVRRIPSESDKRYKKIELTDQGKKLYSELIHYAEETLNEAYTGIERQEIESCLTTLDKIAERIDRM